MATQGFSSSLELRVQFCLLVCCTYPSLSTVNKEKNLTDQRASLRVDTRETQQVSNQNGISLLYIMLEIHHSGWEPWIYGCFEGLEPESFIFH